MTTAKSRDVGYMSFNRLRIREDERDARAANATATIRNMNISVGQFAEIVKGSLRFSPHTEAEFAASFASAVFGKVVADSRQVKPGDVFWALKGAKHDGAAFVGEALRRGAVGAIVDQDVEPSDMQWVVRVEDSYQALVDWVAWKRRNFSGTMIAVTGSVGKTTTRQMIRTVLSRKFRGTASPRNYNNHFGVPLSMLQMESNHDYAVIEIGASKPGEIASLSKLCLPKIAVITQVGDAHLGGFGSRQCIAESKAELLEALPLDGQAILGDDPWLRVVTKKCGAEITWVGLGEECDLIAKDVRAEDGRLRFRVVAASDSRLATGTHFSVPVWGRHHVTAVLAAAAVGRLMGVDMTEIAAALEEYQPVPMRCEVRRLRGATVINDAYNANPTSMRAALELLHDLESSARKIVVCGDMGELGEESSALHWELGRQTVEVAQASIVIACGEFAQYVVGGARAAGISAPKAIACERVEDALPYLGQIVSPGDVVLVKGSRMMAMERVVEALERYPQRRSA